MTKTELREELQPVALRSLTPGIPDNPEEKALLKEDLRQLGCVGLLAMPWNLKDEHRGGGESVRNGGGV